MKEKSRYDCGCWKMLFLKVICRYNKRVILIAEEFFKSNAIPEQGEGIALEYDLW